MNWAIAVLPFLEQQPLYEQYDPNEYNTHPNNMPVLQTHLAVMSCPSDRHANLVMEPRQFTLHYAASPGPAATGSYKGVSGKRWGADNGYYDYPNFANDPGRVAAKRGPLYMVEPGKLGQVRAAHIRDGASNTMLVGEYATTDSVNESANGMAFWASTHSFHNEGSPQREMSSRIPDYDECMAMTGNKWWRCDRAFASLHLGNSINFVLCDGSVHALDQYIDGTLFENLGTINGREIAALP